MMWVYEDHLGRLFATERPLTAYDWEIGSFNSFAEFLAYYADDIDCEDGHGGWNIDYVIKAFVPGFDRRKAINIVMANREGEDDDEAL